MKADNREKLNLVLGLLYALQRYEDGDVCDIIGQSTEYINEILKDEAKGGQQ